MVAGSSLLATVFYPDTVYVKFFNFMLPVNINFILTKMRGKRTRGQVIRPCLVILANDTKQTDFQRRRWNPDSFPSELVTTESAIVSDGDPTSSTTPITPMIPLSSTIHQNGTAPKPPEAAAPSERISISTIPEEEEEEDFTDDDEFRARFRNQLDLHPTFDTLLMTLIPSGKRYLEDWRLYKPAINGFGSVDFGDYSTMILKTKRLSGHFLRLCLKLIRGTTKFSIVSLRLILVDPV
jgi:hypothetical protein